MAVPRETLQYVSNCVFEVTLKAVFSKSPYIDLMRAKEKDFFLCLLSLNLYREFG